jgi:hypothetical protein
MLSALVLTQIAPNSTGKLHDAEVEPGRPGRFLDSAIFIALLTRAHGGAMVRILNLQQTDN